MRFIAAPLVFAALATVVFSLAACDDDLGGQGPVIDMVVPAASSPGETIQLSGDRFCSDDDADVGTDGRCLTPPAALVNFGEGAQVVRANAVSYTQESITVVIPSSASLGATVIVVVRDGVPSNALPFEVLPGPGA
jgi:hypothetical protein